MQGDNDYIFYADSVRGDCTSYWPRVPLIKCDIIYELFMANQMFELHYANGSQLHIQDAQIIYEGPRSCFPQFYMT